MSNVPANRLTRSDPETPSSIVDADDVAMDTYACATLSASCHELLTRSAEVRERSQAARRDARRAIERAEKILTRSSRQRGGRALEAPGRSKSDDGLT
jgi:hypothetical protein